MLVQNEIWLWSFATTLPSLTRAHHELQSHDMLAILTLGKRTYLELVCKQGQTRLESKRGLGWWSQHAKMVKGWS
jgi:hypothetical protein